MKIGILTLPLHTNYGGILQNYALQTILKVIGHESYTINIQDKQLSLFRKILIITKRLILKQFKKQIPLKVWYSKSEYDIIAFFIQQFIHNNINLTIPIYKKVKNETLEEYSFDAFIIGSDQVWRPRFSPQLSTYFLDFVDLNSTVNKIAYAASFGVDNSEFTYKQRKKYSKLLSRFDAVSVREDSAVNICKEYFNIEASRFLDPTMLLSKIDYEMLVNSNNVRERVTGNSLYTYILDKNYHKSKIIDLIAKDLELSPYSVIPKISKLEIGAIDDRIFPSVEDWIKGFMDAQFVVTDSFHGTVFSILFNKPFISIVNEGRGADRFFSLLRLFDLEDRLVTNEMSFNIETMNEINWTKVNTILEKEKIRSIQFLEDHLTRRN